LQIPPSISGGATTPFTQARIDSSAAITSDNTTLIHTEYGLFRDSCPLAYTTHYLLTRYTDTKSAALDSATFIDVRGKHEPAHDRHEAVAVSADKKLRRGRKKLTQ